MADADWEKFWGVSEPTLGGVIKAGTYDQARKFDAGKLRYELIPVEVLEALAKVLTYGAKKYGDNSWQKVEPFEDRYYAAALRHILAWRSGENLDPESGYPHLYHALCNLAFLVSKKG